jgi:succinate dehydrogenase hydrophobic anchor subunit
MLNWTEIALTALAFAPFVVIIVAAMLVSTKMQREAAAQNKADREFNEETARQIREINAQFEREMKEKTQCK